MIDHNFSYIFFVVVAILVKVQRFTSERHKWRGARVSASEEAKPTAFMWDERKRVLWLTLTGKDIQQSRESTFPPPLLPCFCDASASPNLHCYSLLIYSEVCHRCWYGPAHLHPFPYPIISWVTDSVSWQWQNKVIFWKGEWGHIHRDGSRWGVFEQDTRA